MSISDKLQYVVIEIKLPFYVLLSLRKGTLSDGALSLGKLIKFGETP
jgi:hypothetical protein